VPVKLTAGSHQPAPGTLPPDKSGTQIVSSRKSEEDDWKMILTPWRLLVAFAGRGARFLASVTLFPAITLIFIVIE
jgi:hypothetical protein